MGLTRKSLTKGWGCKAFWGKEAKQENHHDGVQEVYSKAVKACIV